MPRCVRPATCRTQRNKSAPEISLLDFAPQLFYGLCFAPGFLADGQKGRSDVDLTSMSEVATPPARKRPAEKNGRPRAAKFREETPRKGGGFAIKDRNTALQQYDGTTFYTQAPKDTLANFTPRKSSKNPTIALNIRRFCRSATFCAVQNKLVFRGR
jgi:hypothetical protein